MSKEDRKRKKPETKRPRTTKTSREDKNPKKKITKRPARRGHGNINIFPDHILVSIFLRLPSRSVAAVGKVCKSWHSLTSPSSFVLQHADRARTSIIIQPQSPYYRPFCYHIDHSKFSKQIVQKNLYPRTINNYAGETLSELQLLASCNGLVCFRVISRKEYIVGNPLTNEWVTVHDRALFAAFYFHRSTGEYRLLQYHIGSFGTEVISINGVDDKWRTLTTCCEYSLSNLRARKQISIRGSIHWPPHPTDSWMLAFDTESENFRRMSLSQLRNKDTSNQKGLMEMEGSLGLCQLMSFSYEMEVWFLKDYAKEEWIKRYSISLGSIATSLYRRRELNHCEPLAVWNSGKELLLKFYDIYDKFNCFVLYDLGSKGWRKQKISTLYGNLRNWVPYAESLVSWNSLKK